MNSDGPGGIWERFWRGLGDCWWFKNVYEVYRSSSGSGIFFDGFKWNLEGFKIYEQGFGGSSGGGASAAWGFPGQQYLGKSRGNVVGKVGVTATKTA